LRSFAVGPLRLLMTVCSSHPFALSLSKGQAEPVEAFVPRAMGFDRLNPNNDKTRLRYLSPNGSLRTLNFVFGPFANLQRADLDVRNRVSANSTARKPAKPTAQYTSGTNISAGTGWRL
jgi:hypothetical protein